MSPQSEQAWKRQARRVLSQVRLRTQKRACEPMDMSKEENAEQRQILDLISDKHGPRMLPVPTEERAWPLEVHKNMGHPNPTKLKTFCQQLDCRQEMIEAIDDLNVRRA